MRFSSCSHHSPRYLPVLATLLLVGGLATGCDGNNLFDLPSRSDDSTTDTEPGTPPPTESDLVLRFVEEGTLLQRTEDRLRFRWERREPLQLDPGADTPDREREAIRAALEEIDGLPVPPIVWAPGAGDEAHIAFRSFPPDEYRERDPTRPWSFSRSFVTATAAEGITDVEILLSLELSDDVLQRAVLHGLGHAMGIMGHPAFPGEPHVMAVRPEDDDEIPVRFAPLERSAFEFLYSDAVRAGMTRAEMRSAFEEWSRP